MNDLPQSWERVDFDEAVDVVSDRGFRVKQKDYVPAGPLAVVDQGEGLIGGYTKDLSAKVESTGPVIVFGDHTRRFKYVTFPFAVGADGVKLFAPKDFWNPSFLFNQLTTLDLEDRGYGRHYQHLRKEKLALPPFREQTRIVAKLEELLSDLDAGVAELKAAQKKLQQYRQSLLKAAVEGALTADWREAQRQQGAPTETGAQLLTHILTERRARWEAKQLARFREQGKVPPDDWRSKYVEPLKPNTTDLAELPDGWVWSSVDQAGEVQLGRQRAPQFHSGSNMVPYLRVANVFENRIDISDVMEMHFSAEEEAAFSLHHNDILLNEGQSLELIGRPAIYRNELPRACFTNTLVRFRITTPAVPEFALATFRHYMHSGRFRKIAKITTNIAHLGAGRFSELEFPMPGAAEQREIVRRLSEQFTLAAEQEEVLRIARRQLHAQRQNILRSAFLGKLIPQDPNDEPASAVLERIRTQRAEQVSKAKASRTKRYAET